MVKTRSQLEHVYHSMETKSMLELTGNKIHDGINGKKNVLWKSVETKSMTKQILANCMVDQSQDSENKLYE